MKLDKLTLKDEAETFDSDDDSSDDFEDTDTGPPEVEVFQWIERNFQRLLTGQANMTRLLAQFHRSLQRSVGEDEEPPNLGTHLVVLISKHRENEKEFTVVLQFLYQIFNTLKAEEVQLLHLDAKVLDTLIDIILASSASSISRQTLANILSCVQLAVQKSNTPKEAIGKLWSSLEQKSSVEQTTQIVVQIFDEFVHCIPDFHRCPQLIAITQLLLASGEREERKIACFLIRKILCVVRDQSDKVLALDLQLDTRNWSAYLTLMENLEENQSHLILPSLEALKSIDGQPQNASWQSWLNILHVRVLAHNNILVKRWAIEYFLATFSCAALCPQVLLQFLQAVNNTNLYNGEGGGYFLPQSNIGKFLNSNGASAQFWDLFASVSWKSVPLHFWFGKLQALDDQSNVQPKEVLLKLAACVRVLQNPQIRRRTLRLFERLFAKSIENLKLVEYVQFIETLYNVSDFYWTSQLENWHIFLRKLQQNGNSAIADDTFSKRFYDILTNYIDFDLVDIVHAQIPAILKYLELIPKETHGWLRFLVVFHCKETEEMRRFCWTNYKIDFFSLKYEKVDYIRETFLKELVWHQSETSFVRENTVDWISKVCLNNFFDIINMEVPMEELISLEMGTRRTLLKVSKLLALTNVKLNSNILVWFLEGLKKISKTDIFCSPIVGNILKYCQQNLTPLGTSRYAESILNLDLENIGWCICSSYMSSIILRKDCYVRGISHGDAKTGDARIEAYYEHDILKDDSKLLQMRYWYIRGARDGDTKAIVDELLLLNNALSRNKPRYFENSKEHRYKLRMAVAISGLIDKVLPYWSDDLWKILLEQNNQLNITCLFEIVIARCVPNVGVILKQLSLVSKFTPSQQASVICVTHAYIILNFLKESVQWTREQMESIIDALLPLTMGANFQTRTYSQLAIYSILENWSKQGLWWDVSANRRIHLKAAISAAFGDQLTDLLEDVRLKWPFFEPDRLEDQILYITDAPFDEYYKPGLNSSIEKSKEQFAKKHSSSFAKHATPIAVDANNYDFGQVQRKLNPSNDVVLQNNLITYPNHKNYEIYVVASLVDKLPNLGGIARTCEVLGINNLVMDSKSDVEKSDFKNLSMTAEKALNIIEIKTAELSAFLIQKKIEGFEIVGAEQTANSASFVGFNFPKKCILLLGHEKEGIPPNLLAFLDHAVEIPQFGLVRSLNVHVTGALFMWEYCKQHIVEN